MIKKLLFRLFGNPSQEQPLSSSPSPETPPANRSSSPPAERQQSERPKTGRSQRTSGARNDRRPRKDDAAQKSGPPSRERRTNGIATAERVDRSGEQAKAEDATSSARQADTETPAKRRRRRKPSEAKSAPPPKEAVEAIVGPQPRDVPFGPMMVSAPVARALGEMGYVEPTPIQEAVIAPMMEGNDLVGQAQTGTGKTAGFGIPLAEFIDASVEHTQAVVLVPTRELARQVTDELSKIAKYRGIRTVAVYGGAPIGRQLTALKAGAHVVVGTPGRVIDVLDRGALQIDQVRTVVLDEADQMLDIGFLPDIRRILRSTPRSRQTALFSATIPTMIRRLIYSYLKEPKWVRVGEESEPVETVRQLYCEVARRDKPEALLEVLRTIGEDEQALVFRRTQEDVDWLVRTLKRKKIAAEAIHGGLPQGERNSVMQDFRAGKLKLLVSTNLTSRGIDVPTVAHVINYDIPEQVEEYVHRIGRTARMGREGTAVTFVGEWDLEYFDAIREHVGAENLEEMPLTLYPTHDAAG